MTIEEFWNQAFLSCLTRLPAEEARIEADKATQICVGHWGNYLHKWVHYSASLKDEQISSSNVYDHPLFKPQRGE